MVECIFVTSVSIFKMSTYRPYIINLVTTIIFTFTSYATFLIKLLPCNRQFILLALLQLELLHVSLFVGKFIFILVVVLG